MGPHRQNDRLILNRSAIEQKEVIIEDCQVPVDNMSYADWLLQQGIDSNVDVLDRSDVDIK